MDDPAFPDSHYTSTTTATTTTTTVQSPPLKVDIGYVKSIPGILRIVQICVLLLYWILLASCPVGGYPLGISIVSWIFTIIFFVIFLLQLDKRVPAVHWVLTELFHDLGWAILHFIAACLVANFAANIYSFGFYYNHGCVSFSAVLGFAVTILYGISTFFDFRRFQAGGGLSRLTGGSGATGAPAATTTTTVTTTEYSAEKGGDMPPAYPNP
ncbi:plasmolipin-like isoform X1 [Acanthaster planci]|uniref:Plasmolipin-like isoform X1 n=1 Tax=Acanthaster planci TaxID=133434 RepID=A0A8B7YFB2_ACAPL|nr:plasmolipin-like isoform X1 [Acanthaster planci]